MMAGFATPYAAATMQSQMLTQSYVFSILLLSSNTNVFFILEADVFY
jgi:hypothetical protein